MDIISEEFNCSAQQSSGIFTETQIYAPHNKDKTHNIYHPLKNYQGHKENITLNEEENKLIKINPDWHRCQNQQLELKIVIIMLELKVITAYHAIKELLRDMEDTSLDKKISKSNSQR